MKVPVQMTHTGSSRRRHKVRPHAKLLYRAHKQVSKVNVSGFSFFLYFFTGAATRLSPLKLLFLLQVVPVGLRGADFLASRFSLPTKVLLRLVGSEASRLSKSNRQRTITLQELATAVTLIQQKTRTRAAA